MASSIPETWTRFTTLEDARHAVKPMYRDDRVLRLFVVSDCESSLNGRAIE